MFEPQQHPHLRLSNSGRSDNSSWWRNSSGTNSNNAANAALNNSSGSLHKQGGIPTGPPPVMSRGGPPMMSNAVSANNNTTTNGSPSPSLFHKILSMQRFIHWYEVLIFFVLIGCCCLAGYEGGQSFVVADITEEKEYVYETLALKLSLMMRSLQSAVDITHSLAAMCFAVIEEGRADVIPDWTAPAPNRQKVVVPNKFLRFAEECYRETSSLVSIQTRPGGVLTQIYPSGSAPYGLDLEAWKPEECIASRLENTTYIAGPRLLAQGYPGFVTYRSIWLNSTTTPQTTLRFSDPEGKLPATFRNSGIDPTTYWGHVGVVINLQKLIENVVGDRDPLRPLSVHIFNDRVSSYSAWLGDVNATKSGSSSSFSVEMHLYGITIQIYQRPAAILTGWKALLISIVIAVGSCMFVVVAGGFVVYHRQIEVSVQANNESNACALAESCAALDFEELSHLERIANPSKLELAFLNIIRILKEYKTYVPVSLFAVSSSLDDSMNLDDNDQQQPSSAVHIAHNSTHTSLNIGEDDPNSSESNRGVSTSSALQQQTKSTLMMNRLNSSGTDLTRDMRREHVCMVSINLRGTHGIMHNPMFAVQLSECIRVIMNTVSKGKGVPVMYFSDRVLVAYNGVTRCANRVHHACSTMITISQVLESTSGGSYTVSMGSAQGEALIGDIGFDVRSVAVIGLCVNEAVLLERLHSCNSSNSSTTSVAVSKRQQQVPCGFISRSMYADANVNFLLHIQDVKRFAKLVGTPNNSHGLVACIALLENVSGMHESRDEEWMYRVEERGAINTQYNEAILDLMVGKTQLYDEFMEKHLQQQQQQTSSTKQQQLPSSPQPVSFSILDADSSHSSSNNTTSSSSLTMHVKDAFRIFEKVNKMKDEASGGGGISNSETASPLNSRQKEKREMMMLDYFNW